MRLQLGPIGRITEWHAGQAGRDGPSDWSPEAPTDRTGLTVTVRLGRIRHSAPELRPARPGRKFRGTEEPTPFLAPVNYVPTYHFKSSSTTTRMVVRMDEEFKTAVVVEEGGNLARRCKRERGREGGRGRERERKGEGEEGRGRD